MTLNNKQFNPKRHLYNYALSAKFLVFTEYQALFQASTVHVTATNIHNNSYLSFCSFNNPADTMYQHYNSQITSGMIIFLFFFKEYY